MNREQNDERSVSTKLIVAL